MSGLDEWMNEWIDEWMDECINVLVIPYQQNH